MERGCQQALVQRRAPIFEPHFENCSCGYRKGRSPHEALRKVWQALNAGHGGCVDADLRAFFDPISPDKRVELSAEEISDGRVRHLLWALLRAGAIEGEYWQPTLTGVPQGAVASPLWSNIFLTPFDRAMTAAGFRLTRWADDFVVVCETREEAQRALAFARRFLREDLGVELHAQKTRIVHIRVSGKFSALLTEPIEV
jgi:RNA-directed DNA polymerase